MKFWKLALVAVGLALASQASAVVVGGLMVKADTLSLYAADSSAVLKVEDASRLWLNLIMVPLTSADCPCDTAYVSGLASGAVKTGASYAYTELDSICTAQIDSINTALDSATVVLAVQAREVLTSAAGTDSTYAVRLALLGDSLYADSTFRATALYNSEHSTAAAYSDSTVIPWFPVGKYILGTSTGMTDTMRVNHVSPGNTTAGSSEITAQILSNIGVWSSNRSVRVDLVNINNNAPFRAQFASFRWRLLNVMRDGYGQEDLAFRLSLVRLRVVLGRETF